VLTTLGARTGALLEIEVMTRTPFVLNRVVLVLSLTTSTVPLHGGLVLTGRAWRGLTTGRSGRSAARPAVEPAR